MQHNVVVEKREREKGKEKRKEKKGKREKRKGKKEKKLIFFFLKEKMQPIVAASYSSPRLEPAVSLQTLALLTIHYGLSKEISWKGVHGHCGACHAGLSQATGGAGSERPRGRESCSVGHLLLFLKRSFEPTLMPLCNCR